MTDEPTKAATGHVTVRVDGRSVSCRPGRPLLGELQNAGVVVATSCGGEGTCFLCRVRVVHGAEGLGPATAAEKRGLGNVLLDMGMRLSCQITPVPALEVELPRYETPEQKRERIRRARQRRRQAQGKKGDV